MKAVLFPLNDEDQISAKAWILKLSMFKLNRWIYTFVGQNMFIFVFVFKSSLNNFLKTHLELLYYYASLSSISTDCKRCNTFILQICYNGLG